MKMKRSISATKDDVKKLLTKEEGKKFATKNDLKKFVTKSFLKKELQVLRKDMTTEILQGIAVMHENLLYDFRGSFSDRTVQHGEKLENHEQRITRVEQEMHLAA